MASDQSLNSKDKTKKIIGIESNESVINAKFIIM